jgi:16S rRNA processing protein RimM
MQLVAGRITRPHGIRGEVAVEVRTDQPDVRFATGAVLATEPIDAGPLTVESVRWHQGKLLVRFTGRTDRTSVEPLVGVSLLVDPVADEDDEAFYPHELTGLQVVDGSGDDVGTVRQLLSHPGHDLLEVVRPDGRTGLVPFVEAIVTEVDVAEGRLVVDLPAGLFDEPAD